MAEVAQAARVIALFGNAGKLSKALQRAGITRHRSAIFRWMRPKHLGGTGGRIPSSALDGVMAAARLEGVLITPDLLYGGPTR